MRLGFSAGYLSRKDAQAALTRFQEIARAHYASWEDFSLSGSIALGVRSPIDTFDLGNWRKIARSHEVLRRAQRTTLAHAARLESLHPGRCAFEPLARGESAAGRSLGLPLPPRT